ncbi:uncharacterized protein Z520_07397 [Fonsecaea multimorphosa CBS 102226]|uniref:Uncharacterized protein n=1 Tax=Fonsecaea multimorphosa CBS 102226 TaxID=1442371 RepID=A0A0D2KJ88_9EURO|nr:uncharacterized protein Z520_07397 [Fonsecaea multimorphosa CBS 102226]KIX96678.1 hypothetical protein Z520_07397 [Fonsecaea multimorphosa CBS 102226]OAL20759.1 hypothetical protein AYO22_08768 [Fonsecaea multimorphosa]
MAIKYLLFDCDNTLVLSEDIAFDVCSGIVNEILERKGITARYSPEELISQFVGLNFRSIMVVLQQHLGFTLDHEEMRDYIKLEEDRVIENIEAKAQPCPGSIETLQKLRYEGKYKLAVVSSSSIRRIKACLVKAGHDRFFHPDNIFSAADSLPFPTSKPNPAVYLHAVQQLGANAKECLTTEDSKSGVLAAVNAKIPCLGYVGSTHTRGQKQEMADHLLVTGCKRIMWDWSEYEKLLAEIEAKK